MTQDSGMTPMLEKVGRAVCIASGREPENWLNPHDRELCIRIAIAAVRALREPDDAMMLAFDCAAVFNGDAMFSEEWAKAIDSILADTGDGE